MSGQERRAASTRKRHALTRLNKLEAQLAEIEKQGYVQTGGFHTGIQLRSRPDSPRYNDRVTELKSQITEARKQAGVTKNDLQIPWRSDTPSILKQVKADKEAKNTWTGGGLGLTFSDRYTPKDLKNELGPTPDNKPTGTVQSTAKSNLQINPFDGQPAVHTIPTTTKTKAKKESSEYKRALRIVERHASGKNSVQLAKAQLLIRRYNEA